MIKPTEENVIEYIKAQEKIADRSEKFSEVWQKVIYKNPELDRTLKHPVSYNALHISKEEVSKNKRQKINYMLSRQKSVIRMFGKNTKAWKSLPIPTIKTCEMRVLGAIRKT